MNETLKFKSGDVREDGFRFSGYQLARNGKHYEKWLCPESWERGAAYRKAFDKTRKAEIKQRNAPVILQGKLALQERLSVKHNFGDIRNDGFIFQRYMTVKRDGKTFTYECWHSPEAVRRARLSTSLWHKRNRTAQCKKRRERFALNAKAHNDYKAYLRDYGKKNRARANAYYKHKRLTDPVFHCKCTMRVRLHKVLRTAKAGKPKEHTFDLVGCSAVELVAHIERQFKPGMTWENRNLWHIDHIKPFAAIDVLDINQLKEVMHYTNLQPLWASENLAKGKKVAVSN